MVVRVHLWVSIFMENGRPGKNCRTRRGQAVMERPTRCLVAQLAEHLTLNQADIGSNPIKATILYNTCKVNLAKSISGTLETVEFE